MCQLAVVAFLLVVLIVCDVLVEVMHSLHRRAVSQRRHRDLLNEHRLRQSLVFLVAVLEVLAIVEAVKELAHL